MTNACPATVWKAGPQSDPAKLTPEKLDNSIMPPVKSDVLAVDPLANWNRLVDPDTTMYDKTRICRATDETTVDCTDEPVIATKPKFRAVPLES